MSENNELFAFPCDVCHCDEAISIESVRFYTGGQEMFTCSQCGFVYAHLRRSDEIIKQTWANEMFRGTFEVEEEVADNKPTSYTSKVPAVTARLTYALEFVDNEIGLEDRNLCDVGAGEGDFIELAKKKNKLSNIYAIEPSSNNCKLLDELNIESFNGGIEEYCDSGKQWPIDLVTVNWTIENSQSARRFIESAFKIIDDGGYVAIATGSRILVPFKKPLHYYFNKVNPVDLHSFHFSYNALCSILISCGFNVVSVNRYIDTDYLCVIAKKENSTKMASEYRDDPKEVLDFFNRWDKETKEHYL